MCIRDRGYYSRVRNLQKAAKIVCAQYGGQLPADYNALLALPGIGEYTAGAIADVYKRQARAPAPGTAAGKTKTPVSGSRYRGFVRQSIT